ncbi:hypothetical protein Leryth_002632 [Lithospermum erythrorhizon]|nr:hypothetical protein Leryth_002632 [Lithospermum erythrorhizon]
MDTLFTLVTHQSNHHHQQQSFDSISTTSKSSKQNNFYHQEVVQQECFNPFMDEDDFSSSSSKQNYPTFQQQPSKNPTPSNTPSNTTPTPPHDHHQSSADNIHLISFSPAAHDINQEFGATFNPSAGNGDGRWASDIILEAARAIVDKNSSRVQQLMWMLNELGSPYGDIDQKLASYFLQALFSRMTDSGERSYRTLMSALEKTCSFESTRQMVLKFQEVSPWTTFGHVACNGAIMEAFDGHTKLHIVDISNTFCTQWPTLLEALATRTDETPHLRLTTVVHSKSSSAAVEKVMKEIGNRMEKFARLMGVPYNFNIIHHAGDLSELNFKQLDIKEDEALAINCVNSLHMVNSVNNRREALFSMFRSLQPRIVTIVEEEADLDLGVDGLDFVKGFQECLRWFRVFFESLDDTFLKTSNERLMLERQAGRAIMDLVACQPFESTERRERASRWSDRLHAQGFSPISFSEELCDDVRALLRRYKEGWSMASSEDSAPAGIFLSWKDQPVVWASAWRPSI